MQENYKILGLSEGATKEEILTAYNSLKEKYSRDRFLEGEAGNEAAKNLTKLENAYAEIMENLREKEEFSQTKSSNLTDVENLLKEGKYDAAQSILDNITQRNAEWHYLQSVIFYKKTWFNESKKQLEIAMDLEPYNSKYSDSYTKLKQKMEYTDRQFHSGNADYSNANNTNRQMGGDAANDCLSFCATWCCMDMMCHMCCR